MLTQEQGDVRRGAKLLDEKKPDWFRFPFRWDHFKIGDGNLCLLGQMYADQAPSHSNGYIVGMGQLGMTTHPSDEAKQHGFFSRSYDTAHYNAIRDAWRFEVEKRLENPKVKTAPQRDAEKLLTDAETELILHLLKDHRRRTNDLSLHSADDRHLGMLDAEVKLITSIEGKL